MNYLILLHVSIVELQAELNTHAANGWRLVGQVQAIGASSQGDSDYFVATMQLEES